MVKFRWEPFCCRNESELVGEREGHSLCTVIPTYSTTRLQGRDTEDNGEEDEGQKVGRRREGPTLPTTPCGLLLGGYKEGEFDDSILLLNSRPAAENSTCRRTSTTTADHASRASASESSTVWEWTVIAQDPILAERDGANLSVAGLDDFPLRRGGNGAVDAVLFGGLSSEFEYLNDLWLLKVVVNSSAVDDVGEPMSSFSLHSQELKAIGSVPSPRLRASMTMHRPSGGSKDTGTSPCLLLVGGQGSEGEFDDAWICENIPAGDATENVLSSSCVWRQLEGLHGHPLSLPSPRFNAVFLPLCPPDQQQQSEDHQPLLLLIGGANFHPDGYQQSLSEVLCLRPCHHRSTTPSTGSTGTGTTRVSLEGCDLCYQWESVGVVSVDRTKANDESSSTPSAAEGGDSTNCSFLFPPTNGHVVFPQLGAVVGGKNQAEGCDDIFCFGLLPTIDADDATAAGGTSTSSAEGQSVGLSIFPCYPSPSPSPSPSALDIQQQSTDNNTTSGAVQSTAASPHWRYTAAACALPIPMPMSTRNRGEEVSWLFLLVAGQCRHPDEVVTYRLVVTPS